MMKMATTFKKRPELTQILIDEATYRDIPVINLISSKKLCDFDTFSPFRVW